MIMTNLTDPETIPWIIFHLMIDGGRPTPDPSEEEDRLRLVCKALDIKRPPQRGVRYAGAG